MEGTTKLKTQLLVNDIVVPLDDFVQRYIGNVLKAIALSLGYSGMKVSLNIEKERVSMNSEGVNIPVDNEFSRTIVESTIKGMLSPLQGVVWVEKVTITSKE